MKYTYHLISTLFLAGADVGWIEHPIQEWHFAIVDKCRADVLLCLVTGVVSEVTLHICKRCAADLVSEGHYTTVGLQVG